MTLLQKLAHINIPLLCQNAGVSITYDNVAVVNYRLMADAITYMNQTRTVLVSC